MSSRFINNVHILHGGGEEELYFIDYLEKALAKYQRQSYIIEYTKFQKYQAKDTILHNDAVRYKKDKLPMIVLVSKSFFNLIWITSFKQSIINVITNHSTKNCLHIWMDVNEDHVRYRSVQMCRIDGHFQRIKASELTKLNTDDMISRIYGLISANGDAKFDPLNNYEVDDDEEEMCRRFHIATFGKEQPKPASPKPIGNNRPKAKPKKDVYKNALRMLHMTKEEVEALPSEQQGAQAQAATSSKRKRRNKKKSETGTIKLLTEITEKDKTEIANYLDKGFGANWKQLAETFGVTSIEIRKITNYPPRESKTIKLIEHLNTKRPELAIDEFAQNCRRIQRNDVVVYIQDNIMK